MQDIDLVGGAGGSRGGLLPTSRNGEQENGDQSKTEMPAAVATRIVSLLSRGRFPLAHENPFPEAPPLSQGLTIGIPIISIFPIRHNI